MSLEIEIKRTIIENIITNNFQQRFNTTPIAPLPPSPPLPQFYVDHLNVTGITTNATTRVAKFSVTADIFAVEDQELHDHANGVPPGALLSKGYGTFVIVLSLSGTTMSLTCENVIASNPLFQPIADKIKTQFALPTSSKVKVADPGLLIRFQTTTPAKDHLQTGQDWCLLLDGPTVESLIAGKLAPAVQALKDEGINDATPHVTWAPRGSTAHVSATIRGHRAVPVINQVGVEVTLEIDFQLPPPTPGVAVAELQELITWDFNFSTGITLVNAIIEDIVERRITADTFGSCAVAVGDHQILLKQPLLLLKLDTAVFQAANVFGNSDGLILGGPVTGLRNAGQELLTTYVKPFGNKITRTFRCKGSPADDSGDFVKASASCSIGGADRYLFGSATVVSPKGAGAPDLHWFLTSSPDPNHPAGRISVEMVLSPETSLAVHNFGKPVEVRLITTRGVRNLNFGLPPDPKFEGGKSTNIELVFINDCDFPSEIDPWYKIFRHYNPKWSPYPPIDWKNSPHQVSVFESRLVTVHGVDIGEKISLAEPYGDGTSVFTAGGKQVVLPCIIPLSPFTDGVTLSRVDRTDLGTIDTSIKIFQRFAVMEMPGALSHVIRGDARKALIFTTFKDRVETTQVDVAGNVSTVKTKPNGENNDFTGWKSNLPGLVRIHPVPGFEQASIAVAEFKDGSFCSLTRDDANATPKVSGTMAPWARMPPASGPWAISASTGDVVAVFRVTDLIPKAEKQAIRQ